MERYQNCLEKVKASIDCKYDMWGTPTAFHICNEEEYCIALEYANLAVITSSDRSEHYKFDYKGKDWYFFEHKFTNLGMDGHDESYWQETLTEKKKKFADYCKQFEE